MNWEDIRQTPITDKIATRKDLEEARKAGYEEAMAQLANMTEECKQMGRKEVVEWINKEDIIDDYCMERWQAKLAEWGIE